MADREEHESCLWEMVGGQPPNGDKAQIELLEDDLLRFMEHRALALEEAALEIQPGPDGQDYLDRSRMIRRWVDAAWERHGEGERAHVLTDGPVLGVPQPAEDATINPITELLKGGEVVGLSPRGMVADAIAAVASPQPAEDATTENGVVCCWAVPYVWLRQLLPSRRRTRPRLR